MTNQLTVLRSERQTRSQLFVMLYLVWEEEEEDVNEEVVVEEEERVIGGEIRRESEGYKQKWLRYSTSFCYYL